MTKTVTKVSWQMLCNGINSVLVRLGMEVLWNQHLVLIGVEVQN